MKDSFGLVGQTLGQYRMIEQIGQGGMATVFKAFQPGLNREVALKVLPPHFAQQTDFTERFAREAQAIGNLHHPNILPVYDSGQDKGYSFIAMRYIPNARTLADEMRAALKTERMIEVISQVAGALEHAHKAGIIHRDVKPSNVLLDGQWALLSDFGLAKMVENPVELTGTGVGMGTPAYMSPEQGMGKKVDHRTDIYALGIILYEMLTGQVPHKAETPIATVMKRINEPLPMPRSLNPNIPEAVERVLLKALAVDPADRFNGAGELATALKAAFGPSPNEVLADVSTTYISPIAKTATSAEERTRVAASPTGQEPKRKTGLSASLLGFGAIGLLLLLILVGIGVLIFFQLRPDNTEKAQSTSIATSIGLVITPTAVPTNTPAPTLTAKPEVTESTSDSLNQATSTPKPAQTAPAEATATAVPPTAAAATSAPANTPDTSVAPVAKALTGEEVHQLALAEAQKWQGDAVLSEIATSGLAPLNPEGKTSDWILKFWSPSSKGLNTIMLISGALTTSPTNLPVPKATVLEGVILDTAKLYQLADQAGAAKYTAQGYRPSAAITPYPLDENKLTWYLNYAGGDYRVVYTVIIDAKSGEVIQAIDLQ
jgi:serine/threonine protein kinase